MDEIVGRKLRVNSPTMIPNAVGRNMASHPLDFEQPPPESVNELINRLRLKKSTIVVGYIGSLRALEGVDYTAKAVANCASDGLDIRFLVCSSKKNQTQLRDLCSHLQILLKRTRLTSIPLSLSPVQYKPTTKVRYT